MENPCEGHSWHQTVEQRERKCTGCGLPESTHKFRLTVMKLVSRVNRFKRFLLLGAPEIIIEHERLLIEKACADAPTSAEVRKSAKELMESIAKDRELDRG